MFVRNAMNEDVTAVSLDANLGEAYQLMKQKGYDELPVLDRGRKLAGVVQMADILKAAEGLDSFSAALARPVQEVMTARVFTVGPDDLIEKAAKLLWDKDVPLLPVIDEGRLIGVLAEADIFKAFAEMLGVDSQTTRFTLLVGDRRGQLARIAEIIRDAGVSITHLATFYSKVFKQYKIIVRVETDKAHGLIELLEQHGYKVIHVDEN